MINQGSPGYMYNNAYGDPSSQPMQPGMPMMGGPSMYGNPSAYGQPMMGGPMMMPPPGVQMGGMTGLDPMYMSVQQIMNTIQTGIYVKQKFDVLEAMTGCDTPNRYYVFEQSSQGAAKKKKIFRCKEKSGWCARNCMSADCKPFQMEISKCFKEEEYDEEHPVIILDRECKCTCMCCNRPTMTVNIVENGQNRPIGRVVDSWDCVNYSFTIYDAQDKKRFFIKAGCCQCGFWCKCPCETCESITFDLYSGEEEKPEAPILKKGTGSCIKNAAGSADHFACPFPMTATWEDKVLLLSAILMIDFMMFEEKAGNTKGPAVGINDDL